MAATLAETRSTTLRIVSHARSDAPARRAARGHQLAMGCLDPSSELLSAFTGFEPVLIDAPEGYLMEFADTQILEFRRYI